MWSANASLSVDISELLPYLNAVLQDASLCSGGEVLLWKAGGRKYAFRPREICSAPVRDNEEAQRVIAEAVQMANDVWNRRDELEADITYREPPTMLEIYRLLPRSNCGKCGRSTCMAYANDLREGAAEPSECLPLCEPGHETERQRLLELLGEEIFPSPAS